MWLQLDDHGRQRGQDIVHRHGRGPDDPTLGNDVPEHGLEGARLLSNRVRTISRPPSRVGERPGIMLSSPATGSAGREAGQATAAAGHCALRASSQSQLNLFVMVDQGRLVAPVDHLRQQPTA